MQLKQLLSDDEGVSPVIGVILMVAITVILAAVIAAFVLGLGDSGQDTPQMSFDFDYDGSTALTITAESGDTIDAGQLSFSGDVDAAWTDSSDFSSGDNVNAGSSVILDDGSNGINVNSGSGVGSDNTVNVVWESPDGDDSSILATFNGN